MAVDLPHFNGKLTSGYWLTYNLSMDTGLVSFLGAKGTQKAPKKIKELTFYQVAKLTSSLLDKAGPLALSRPTPTNCSAKVNNPPQTGRPLKQPCVQVLCEKFWVGSTKFKHTFQIDRQLTL